MYLKEEIEYNNSIITTNSETKTLTILSINENYYKLVQPNGNLAIGMSTCIDNNNLLIMLDTDENTQRDFIALKICNNKVIKFKQILRENNDKTVVQIGIFKKE